MKWILRARPAEAFLLAGALVAVIAAGGCASKPVATIDGLPVTQEDFNERCADFVITQQSAGQSVCAAVLGNLIMLKIMEKELRDKNKLPSDADVNRRMETLKKQSTFMQQPLDEQLRRQGRTEASLKRDLRDQMVGEEFRLKDIKVTDAEARQYYDRHANDPSWSQEERVQLAVLAVDNKADLDKALSELRSNAKFNDVANAVAKGQWRQISGPINHWFTRSDLKGGQNLPIPPLVIAKAFDLPMGQYSDPPVKMGTDPKDPGKVVWFIVEATQKQPSQRMPFEDVKDLAIRGARIERAQSRMQQLSEEFKKMASSAQIEVSRPEWQELARQYRAAMAGGPSGGGAAAPPGSGP
jgi:hypothetical protein